MPRARTIAVQINDERRAARLIDAAATLARDGGGGGQGHVIGIAAFPGLPALTVFTPGVTGSLMDELVAEQKRQVDALGTVFTARIAAMGVTGEFRALTGLRSDVVTAFLGPARACDLIVAPTRDETWALSPILDFPERLAVAGGLPVLVVPATGLGALPLRRGLVAWNGSREAARALKEVLDILARDAVVTLVSVGEDGRREAAAPTLDEVAALVRRHGFEAEAVVVDAGGRSVGRVIADIASARGADVVALGAYGHSRWRELMFGGVTREIAANLPIPALLTH
ncbi:MAG: universal stress protein [Hyphomicrobiaceae bacterium]|nr:universal stress protein [Hyphomicrobiaceae bacterium]